MKINEQFVDKLYKIPWFSNCGKQSSLNWALCVNSASEVAKMITSIRWQNIVLDNRGDITEQLSIRSCKGMGTEYQEWNNLVSDFKNNYLPQLEAQWKSALGQIDLDIQEVMNDISFNILAIVMADAYKEIVAIPTFFTRLLEIYEAGHLPCGWKGKKEKGAFIIF